MLDSTDKLLLQQLQKNADSGINELAEVSHLSTASVQRRVRRLKQTGVIEKKVNVLNPAMLDKAMTFIVMVEMESERADQIDEFKRVALKEKCVQQCYYVTGEADFVLICLTKDMQEYEALSKRLFFDNSNVRRFTTSVTMGRTKVSLEVPFD